MAYRLSPRRNALTMARRAVESVPGYLCIARLFGSLVGLRKWVDGTRRREADSILPTDFFEVQLVLGWIDRPEAAANASQRIPAPRAELRVGYTCDEPPADSFSLNRDERQESQSKIQPLRIRFVCMMCSLFDSHPSSENSLPIQLIFTKSPTARHREWFWQVPCRCHSRC